MRNKRVVIVVGLVLIVVLLTVCVVVAGPVLMDAILSMHRIPQH